MPAEAGIHDTQASDSLELAWMAAFAAMTESLVATSGDFRSPADYRVPSAHWARELND